MVRALALRQLQTQQFDLQELRHETFLSCEAGSGTRTVGEQMLRNHRFTPAGIVTLDSYESGKQAMMASMGISLVTLHTPRLELRTHEIAILQVNGTPIDRAWPNVHMSARRLPLICHAFRRFLIGQTDPVLAGDFAEAAKELARYASRQTLERYRMSS